MVTTANITINELDNSQSFVTPKRNLSGVIVDCEMGPIGITDAIISNPTQFAKIYGGIKADNSNRESVTMAIRCLEKGSALRVYNAKHYTNITDEITLDMTKATPGLTHTVNFATTMNTGHTLTLLFSGLSWPGSQYGIAQVFTENHQKTLDLLVVKIKNDRVLQRFGGGVLDVRRLGNKLMVVVYSSNLNFTANVPTLTGVTKTSSNSIVNELGQILMAFEPKYHGEKYQDLILEVKPNAQNNMAFDLKITLLNSLVEPEVYQGLMMDSFNTTTFLNTVEINSQLIKPVYQTVTGVTGTFNPIETVIKYTGGSNGTAIVASDLIGSSISKLGLRAFDGYDDISRLGCFINLNDNGSINTAGVDYAASRKDLAYFVELSGSQDENTIITQRNNLSIDSSYGRFYSAGTKITAKDPKGAEFQVGCLGDIMGLAASSAQNYGYHFSYAGETRGTITGVVKVGNKWGGNLAALDLLAKNQINAVVYQEGRYLISGNFTAQKNFSLLSYASIRDLFLGIKKTIRPTVKPFLEEPNEFSLWKRIYMVMVPYMAELQNSRAAFKVEWHGDQFADSLDNLVVNTASDVQLGKYKAFMKVWPINSLQDFTIGVSLEKGTLEISGD